MQDYTWLWNKMPSQIIYASLVFTKAKDERVNL